MKTTLLFFALAFSLAGFGQPYQANWSSLDQRPVPQWFRDAKFGIFIHWGVYSVPAYCTKGSYAEWYQNGLQTGDSARIRYHREKFGNLSYYQLADQFKAELFKPDEWAKLFEASGAKYIVLTSKHHDGFCLWPSRDADRTWGFPWNAAELGPKRDLLGDLFRAVRKTSVHAGMYYSLYEWFNPLWKADHKKFAAEHAWPQMQDLINTYQPDVFWTDGDWDAPAETWKSQEFLAWLYNQSPVKDRIVVNDRWGSGVRFHHGGIYTPEYQPGLDFDNHYWEESRGMGFSYGYNREEDAWDYNSTQSLVLQLVDKVSRGGNFLLDIGPDEHGKIPPIMQERLLQIGDWMKLNGEAIYNTQKWKSASQWSEGRTDYKPKSGSGDLLLKLTLDPEPGYAVKELFFTYNDRTNALYAISPKYPDNHQLVLKDIILPAGTTVDFLSNGSGLDWKAAGGNTVITLPAYNPNTIKAPYAYVIRINHFGRFAPKPAVSVREGEAGGKPLVSLSAPGADAIYFTADGTEPSINSTPYTKPFPVEKTATIRAIAIVKGALPGATASQLVVRHRWMPALRAAGLKPGLAYRYYEPSGNINLDSASGSHPVKTGIATSISLLEKARKDRFAFAFDGYIRIDKDGLYTFYTQSDDGNKLFIDEEEVVNNDGEHGATEAAGKALLKKGLHKIGVRYFDGGGDNSLQVSIQAGTAGKIAMPATALFH